MGRNKGEGRGLQAGGNTWPTSPLEWGVERGSPRPLEWRKTLGGIAREWEGESSNQGESTPLEWNFFPGGTKPLE